MNEIKNEFTWKGLKEELIKTGLMDIYDKYSSKVKAQYFIKPDGIHGVGHTKRVLLHNLILAYLHKLDKDDIKLLVIAAIYHDIGRTHDGICRVHGEKSIDKMHELGLAEDIDIKDMEVIEFIIKFHCKPDDKALEKLEDMDFEDPARVRLLFEIFKDSDGLDRVRLGDLKVNYLRRSYSKKLVNVAETLLRKNVSLMLGH